MELHPVSLHQTEKDGQHKRHEPSTQIYAGKDCPDDERVEVTGPNGNRDSHRTGRPGAGQIV
jgi:hypothetical protein